MSWFKKKPEVDTDLLELQKTIALLQIISLNLQETADIMEDKVEKITKREAGKNTHGR